MCVESIKQQWCTKWICVFHTFSDQKSVIRAEMNGSNGNINHLFFFCQSDIQSSLNGVHETARGIVALQSNPFFCISGEDMPEFQCSNNSVLKLYGVKLGLRVSIMRFFLSFFRFWNKTKTDDFIDVNVLTGIGDETSGCSTLDHVCRFLLLPFKAYKVWL